MIVLAGDIGGTNARLALAEVDGGQVRIASQERYHSVDYPGLGPIVNRFTQDSGTRPERACFGIACPVVGDDCVAPNLPWTVNVRRLGSEIGIERSGVINDFVAVGYAVEVLGSADVVSLQEGTPVPRGPIGLIGAGTGLGQGILLWEEDHYEVAASEGGHGDFAPIGDLQIGMLRALTARFGRVSWERLLSGPGIANIYECLRSAGVAPEQPTVRAELDAEDDGTVIVRHAIDANDPLCMRAVETLWQVLGAQAGNLALTLVATGGIYIAGGIVPRLVQRLDPEMFLAAFRRKGRLSSLLEKVPVHIITNPSVGLLGAAAAAGRL